MFSESHVVGFLFAAVSAGVYFFVGHRLAARRVTPDAKVASVAFVAWWHLLGMTTLVASVLSMATDAGLTDLQMFTSVTIFLLLLLCLALGCLLYYLLYLFTGRIGWWKPLVAFYSAYFVFLLYYIQLRNPVAIENRRWSVTLAYERDLANPVVTVILLLLLLPQILGALAYLTLVLRVHERTLKFRITVVSLSIIVWFTSSLVASGLQLSQNDWWQIVSRVIGLSAAFAVLIAYYPPGWMKRNFGLRSVDEPIDAEPEEPGTGPARAMLPQGAVRVPRRAPPPGASPMAE